MGATMLSENRIYAAFDGRVTCRLDTQNWKQSKYVLLNRTNKKQRHSHYTGLMTGKVYTKRLFHVAAVG